MPVVQVAHGGDEADALAGGPQRERGLLHFKGGGNDFHDPTVEPLNLEP